MVRFVPYMAHVMVTYIVANTHSLCITTGTMTQFALVIGILIADVFGFWLCTETLWRYMFFIVTILGALPLLMKPLLLESPRWLLARDPDSEHARFVIKALRGFRYSDEVRAKVSFNLPLVWYLNRDTKVMCT